MTSLAFVPKVFCSRAAACAALACSLAVVLPRAASGAVPPPEAPVRNPEVKPCPNPGKGATCKPCEEQENNGSSTDNKCVMVRIGLGDPFPASSGIASHLRVFANDPAPELYTPAGLRLVTGYSVMYTGGGKTAAGVPRSVVVVRPTGLAVTFTYADGESVATAPDGSGGTFPYRLVMTDARGWTTLSDPAYYDLYPGDGSSYRFVAAKTSSDYLQFVSHTSPYGQVSTVRELGVESVRDAEKPSSPGRIMCDPQCNKVIIGCDRWPKVLQSSCYAHEQSHIDNLKNWICS